MPFVYLLATVGIGAFFSAQPAINGAVARVLGSPIPATTLSVAITLTLCLVIMVFGRTTPSLEVATQVPWWAFLSGLAGVLIVGGGTIIVPVTGAAVFFVCLIAGQLIGSILLDHVGAFGLQVRSINPIRCLGILLTLSGVLCVRYG